MRKVLITGAGGFIGRTLAEKLLKKDYFVYGVDINRLGFSDLEKYDNFLGIEVEKNDFSSILNFQIDKLDYVYHLAWAGKLSGKDLNDFELQLSNVIMTNNLLNIIKKINVKKFIFCGSISHYKMNKTFKDVNSDIYGLSKMYAGKITMNFCLNNNIEGNVALLANTYGIGDLSDKAVNTMLKKLQNDESLELIDKQILNDWVYITDTINGLISIAEKGKNYKEYYIGHRNIPTFEQNISSMVKAVNKQVELHYGYYKDNTVADYDKINLDDLYFDTGFECQVSTVDGIKRLDEWIKNLEE